MKNGVRDAIVGGSKNPRRSTPNGHMGNIILIGFKYNIIFDGHNLLYFDCNTQHIHIFYINIVLEYTFYKVIGYTFDKFESYYIIINNL
jgi:hypothetical protein